MADVDGAGVLDIRSVLRVMRRRGAIPIVFVLIAGLAAYAAAGSRPDLYAATAQIRITDPNAGQIFDGIQLRTDPKRDLDTQLVILRSTRIRTLAEERMGTRSSQIESVRMTVIGFTDAVEIRATSTSPVIAREAANSYAAVFLADRRERVASTLQAKADELRTSAAALDKEIDALDAELARAVAEDPTDDERDPLQVQAEIQSLRSQHDSLLRQQSDAQIRANQLEAEAASTIDPALAASKRSSAQGLRRDANGFGAQAAGVSAEIDVLQEELASLGGEDAPTVDVTELESRRAALLDQQEYFRQRASELEIEAVARQGDVELIAAAKTPVVPFSPTPVKDALLAAVLAALMGCGVAFLLDKVDDRIGPEADIEGIVGAPLLGSVLVDSQKKRLRPGNLPRSHRHIVASNSIDAEAYRTIATSLRFSSLGREKQIIAITSAHGSEGKSTITSNLAAALADSGLKIVLVSGDLRRPSIGEVFGIDDLRGGLSHVLMGDTDLDDAVVDVKVESGSSLAFLPSGPIPPNPAELLGSRRMAELLRSLLNRPGGVDYVLIDCPPILPVSDVLAISQFVDGIIMVAVPRRSRQHQLAEAASRVNKVGASIVGVVLNGVARQNSRYGYYNYYRRYELTGTSANTPPRQPAETISL